MLFLLSNVVAFVQLSSEFWVHICIYFVKDNCKVKEKEEETLNKRKKFKKNKTIGIRNCIKCMHLNIFNALDFFYIFGDSEDNWYNEGQ